MLSGKLFGWKKIFAKGPEVLHVVFNVIEKHGPVFLPLAFASFNKDAARKTAIRNISKTKLNLAEKLRDIDEHT